VTLDASLASTGPFWALGLYGERSVVTLPATIERLEA